MSLGVATLRQRVEAAITALGAPWTVSPLTWDLFPGAALADLESQSFAVGAPSSEAIGSRARPSGPLAVRTVVSVRVVVRLQLPAHVASLDAALVLEEALIGAVRGVTGAQGPAPEWVSSEREVLGDGTVSLHTVTFHALHTSG